MRFLASTLSILGTAALAARVAAAGADTVGQGNIVPGAYIVEVENDQDPTALYQELETDGIAVDARRDLKFKLFRGGSFRLRNVSSSHAENDAQAQLILQKSSVRSIWPVREIHFPKPALVSLRNGSATAGGDNLAKRGAGAGVKDTYAPHVQTQIDQLHAAGFTGKGIKVGIVDTGVDYTHPALGGCFGPGCVVSYGYDLVGDNWWSGSEPQPDSDPYDNCQGHGTHVAGIVAAQSIAATERLGFMGAAPDVTLGMYKISGCTDYTTSEMILAGFNMAYEDGSDVISCSAGDDSGWAGDVAAVMASRIVEAGVPVVVALGNSGDLGLWQAASPASGEGVTGVGSVDSALLPTLVNAATYTIGNGTNGTFAWQDGAPEFANVTLPVLVLDSHNMTRTDAACAPLINGTTDLSKSLVMLGLSTECTSNEQAVNLVAAGAKNVIFFPLTGSSGFNSLRITFDDDIGLDGVGITSLEQAQIFADAQNQNQKATVAITSTEFAEPAAINYPNKLSASHMSTFSSWGPTWETLLKPQVATPGGNILSTYINGAYAVMGGTSMATPLAAAIMALVMQARGTHDPATLNSAVAATAKRTTWFDGTAVDDTRVAPAAQQGGGLAQAYAAARTPALLSVTSLSFNDSDHFPGPQTFRVSHAGLSAGIIDLKLGHVPAITMYSLQDNGDGTTKRSRFPNPIVNDAAASVAFDDAPGGSVKLLPGGSVDITVTLTPPTGLNATLLPVYSGYITLEGAAVNLSLPYVGVGGSFAKTPAVQPGYAAGCYLSNTDGHFDIPVGSNQTFTIPRPGSNATLPRTPIYPKIVVRPTMGSRLIRLDLVSASRNSSLPTTDFMGVPSLGLLRKMPAKYVAGVGFNTYFDGALNDGTVVPAGAYKVVVSALKIFGDEKKKDAWTMVETDMFNIVYL